MNYEWGIKVKHTGQALLPFFLALASLAAPAFGQSTVTYTYDALGRLVRSENSGTSTADSTYTLDAADNRTNVTVTGSPFPTFSIDSVSVTEGGTAILTVTKGGATIDTLTVDYASADGTASAGSDYTATGTQTLTFLASDSSKTIAIPTSSFFLNCSPVGAVHAGSLPLCDRKRCTARRS